MSVSRQRRHQLRHPERDRARRAAYAALKSGRLASRACEICGGPAEMHHDDYSKPLAVRFLCRSHHTAVHARPRRAGLPWRPLLPKCILAAARKAGAALNLSPRDFIYLAVRDGLRRFGELPPGLDLSDDELDWIEEATS